MHAPAVHSPLRLQSISLSHGAATAACKIANIVIAKTCGVAEL